jgi:hypothetical protein
MDDGKAEEAWRRQMGGETDVAGRGGDEEVGVRR